MRFNRVPVTMLSTILISFTVGCAGQQLKFMTPIDQTPAIGPSPDMATLVLLRYSWYGAPWVFEHYIDGNLIGETKGGTWFTAKVNPGKHYLMAVGENVVSVYMNFEAGKVYFIDEAATMGFTKVRCTRFAPQPQQDVLNSVKKVQYLQRDPSKGAKRMDPGAYQQAIRDYEQDVKKDPDAYRDILTYQGV